MSFLDFQTENSNPCIGYMQPAYNFNFSISASSVRTICDASSTFTNTSGTYVLTNQQFPSPDNFTCPPLTIAPNNGLFVNIRYIYLDTGDDSADCTQHNLMLSEDDSITAQYCSSTMDWENAMFSNITFLFTSMNESLPVDNSSAVFLIIYEGKCQWVVVKNTPH